MTTQELSTSAKRMINKYGEAMAAAKKVVAENRLVKDRVEALTNMGFNIDVYAMGTGGVLQTKKMKNGSTRIQISYGWTLHNYAYAITIK